MDLENTGPLDRRQTARRRAPGVPGGRLRARPAAGPNAQGFRRGHRRASRPHHASLFPTPARWARISAWCWCAICWRRWRWPPSAATRATATAGAPTRCIRERSPAGCCGAISPSTAAAGSGYGQVLDYVEGRADLEPPRGPRHRRPGRALPEDHLRLLRAVRFAARLGFEIEPATMAALQRLHALIEVSRPSGCATSWRAS
jgi:hypothetical protein